GGETVGVLRVGRSADSSFDSERVRLVEALARRAVMELVYLLAPAANARVHPEEGAERTTGVPTGVSPAPIRRAGAADGDGAGAARPQIGGTGSRSRPAASPGWESGRPRSCRTRRRPARP